MDDLIRRKNRSYTIAFKLEVIGYAENTSNRHASRFYNVDRKRVQEWRKKKTEFEIIKNKGQARVLKGRGRKAMYPTLEEELLDYIRKKREEKNAVTTSMIKKKAKELSKTFNIEDAQFSHGWIVRFKNRHNLVERTRTQIAQKFPEDIPLVVRNFLKKTREKTINIEKKFIISFDETPMWFDMPRNSTLEFQGDLMISTYIPRVIRARPNGFFKNKGIIFVDRHNSHIRDDVIKALNIEGLDVLEIP
ncbi:9122_t:CDS:2, partial [Acaulospora morrowiae]